MEGSTAAPTQAKERALPLTSSQRATLLSLIKDRPVVQNKSTAPGVSERKNRAWQEIAAAFGAAHGPPAGQAPRTAHQLRRSFEHVKRKMKNSGSVYKKKLRAAAAGTPPTPPKLTEETSIPSSSTEADLAMGEDVVDTFTVEPIELNITGTGSVIYADSSQSSTSQPSVSHLTPSTSSSPASPEIVVPSVHTSSVPSTTPSCLPSASQAPSPSLSGPTRATPARSSSKRTFSKEYASCRQRQEEYHKQQMNHLQVIHQLQLEEMKLKIEEIKLKIEHMKRIQEVKETALGKMMEAADMAIRAFQAMASAYEDSNLCNIRTTKTQTPQVPDIFSLALLSQVPDSP